jgi:acetyl-CoA carboxylase biotin carboxyl carrier protein
METRDIKALVNLMNEFGLVELEIEDKKGKVRLVRAIEGVLNSHPAPAAVARVPAGGKRSGNAAASADGAASATGGGPSAPAVELAANQRLVESPMVGTFYRAAAPNAPPFVEEGSSVRKAQALCIIEAMKMMNEIESPVDGRVVRILCNNGQPVEYGQPLIVLEIG